MSACDLPPTSFCTDYYYSSSQYTARLTRADCDGDGILDWVCTGLSGGRGVVLSTRGCKEPFMAEWPYAPVRLCRSVFSELPGILDPCL